MTLTNKGRFWDRNRSSSSMSTHCEPQHYNTISNQRLPSTLKLESKNKPLKKSGNGGGGIFGSIVSLRPGRKAVSSSSGCNNYAMTVSRQSDKLIGVDGCETYDNLGFTPHHYATLAQMKRNYKHSTGKSLTSLVPSPKYLATVFVSKYVMITSFLKVVKGGTKLSSPTLSVWIQVPLMELGNEPRQFAFLIWFQAEFHDFSKFTTSWAGLIGTKIQEHIALLTCKILSG